MIRSVITFLCILLLSTSVAWSKPWSVRDLGRFYKDAHCIQTARKTFRSLPGNYDVTGVRHSSRVACADGI